MVYSKEEVDDLELASTTSHGTDLTRFDSPSTTIKRQPESSLLTTTITTTNTTTIFSPLGRSSARVLKPRVKLPIEFRTLR